MGLALWLAGCSLSPASGGPPYAVHELDDGPVFGPGLQDEREHAVYAGLVVAASGLDAFDRERLTDAAADFLDATDFADQYLAVVQVSAVPASMVGSVPDVAESDTNCTVVASLDSHTPASDEQVVTTLLVRVTAQHRAPPETVRLELHIDDQHRTASGDRVTSGG